MPSLLPPLPPPFSPAFRPMQVAVGFFLGWMFRERKERRETEPKAPRS